MTVSLELSTKQWCNDEQTGWSRVCGDFHIDICCNCWTNSEQQVQWSRESNGKCSLCRVNCDVYHSVHWPHLRCTPESIPHHCLRGLSPLPLDPCPGLHSSTSLCLHMCMLCSQRCLPPFPLRWGHCPHRQRRPGFCNRVYHHFYSLVCCHCCRHRYSCGEFIHCNPCYFVKYPINLYLHVLGRLVNWQVLLLGLQFYSTFSYQGENARSYKSLTMKIHK